MKSFLTVYWAHIIQILNQLSHIVVISTYIHTYLLTYLYVQHVKKTKIICITLPLEYENRIHLLTFSSFFNNLLFKKTQFLMGFYFCFRIFIIYLLFSYLGFFSISFFQFFFQLLIYEFEYCGFINSR